MTKKFLALLLALVMCISFAACGGDKDTASTPSTQSTEEQVLYVYEHIQKGVVRISIQPRYNVTVIYFEDETSFSSNIWQFSYKSSDCIPEGIWKRWDKTHSFLVAVNVVYDPDTTEVVVIK